MTQEDQETLNEIFLGKEDPDMAFKKPMTNNLKEEVERILAKYGNFCYYEGDPMRGGEDLDTSIEAILTLINQKEKEAEVRALFKLSKYYDRLEQSHTKDFEGNEIATWSGYKHFRNPITDRIEELIGVRDDKSIYEWLDRIKQLKEELNKGEQ